MYQEEEGEDEVKKEEVEGTVEHELAILAGNLAREEDQKEEVVKEEKGGMTAEGMGQRTVHTRYN